MLLSCLLTAPPVKEDPIGEGRSLLVLLNSTPEPHEFLIPEAAKADDWRQFVHTAGKAPYDIYPSLNGPPLPRSGAVDSLRAFAALLRGRAAAGELDQVPEREDAGTVNRTVTPPGSAEQPRPRPAPSGRGVGCGVAWQVRK